MAQKLQRLFIVGCDDPGTCRIGSPATGGNQPVGRARGDKSAEAPPTSVAGLAEARAASHQWDRAGREIARRDLADQPLTDEWPPAGRFPAAAGRGPLLSTPKTTKDYVHPRNSLRVRARRRTLTATYGGHVPEWRRVEAV